MGFLVFLQFLLNMKDLTYRPKDTRSMEISIAIALKNYLIFRFTRSLLCTALVVASFGWIQAQSILQVDSITRKISGEIPFDSFDGEITLTGA